MRNVEILLEKAARADKSEDAMRFSQAACNAANALCALKHARDAEVDKHSPAKRT